MNKLARYSQKFVEACIQRPKETGFSALLLVFALFALYESTPPMVSKVFELKIYKSNKAISKLDDPRDISAEKTVWVDHLMLKDGYHLVHPKLGAIGYGDNYFVDIDGVFTVKEAGKYLLYPGSDDGFSLAVDGKTLCQFLGDRAYATRSCRVNLDKGKHNFTLKYFQGGGHSGLTLAYRHEDAKTQKWFGDNSRYIKFN